MLTGFPGEDPAAYDRMVQIIPQIYHLPPPTGVGSFEVHRFSPYHDNPESFDIEITGPDRRYQRAFPVEVELLERLVYRFEFKTLGQRAFSGHSDKDIKSQLLERAVDDWRVAWRGGASLTATRHSDQTLTILDDRKYTSRKELKLTQHEWEFLLHFSVRQPTISALERFKESAPMSWRDLGGLAGVSELYERLKERSIIMELGGYSFHLVSITPRKPSQTQPNQGGRNAKRNSESIGGYALSS